MKQLVVLTDLRANLLVLAALTSGSPAAAVETSAKNAGSDGGSAPVECDGASCTLTYEAGFFSRYAPVTALDMVRNVPGFSLDNGDGSRGFAGSAGNVLIDGKRVSSKSEQPSEVLLRIPASRIERIEVIRGQTGGTDLRGQTVIANVIRRPGGTSGAWTLGGNAYENDDAGFPFGRVSAATEVGPASVTLGLEADRYLGLVNNFERVIGPDESVRETRDEVFRETGYSGTITAQGRVPMGATTLRLNANYSLFDEAGGETSVRTPAGDSSFVLFQGDTDEGDTLELGLDAERPLARALDGKLIGIHRRTNFTETGSLILRDQNLTNSTTLFDSLETESIVRLEFDYARIAGHLIEFAVEGAVNRLESEFEFRRNEGGVLVAQDVPGAVTEVEEERTDLTLSDSFAWGPVAVDLTLAAEFSTITQTGGFADERDFTFLKPGLILTYAPSEEVQYRFNAQREVGQLNFNDFVSAADLGDVELSLGNPALAPESTIALQASLERRFGELGVFTLTAFHDDISDVQDLLPLEGVLEVPGNIGNGTRSGLLATATLPLDGVGLANARLDFSGEWQTSSVTDPLTGEDRRLSGERRWEGNIAFRQDLTVRKFAWGGDVSFFDDAPQFGLDERDSFQSGVDLDAFFETRAIGNLRIRLGFENILGTGTERRREVFAGPRSDGIRAFTEERDGESPRRVFLDISGTF
ncbi:MAG: TonB-dependent receptor [Pseudomonadota bacterium]